MDTAILQNVLKQYKANFAEVRWPQEKFKWEAVQWFQTHWNIDAPNFAEMLDVSLQKTGPLLASMNRFPRRMIVEFAQKWPEQIRALFRDLFDESKDVFQRIEAFKRQCRPLPQKLGTGAINHYQGENTISTYLWLRYPNKYYIYKFSEIIAAAKFLHADYHFIQGHYTENLHSFLGFYSEINHVLQADADLQALLQRQLTEACYPDPQLKTLTVDFGFYLGQLEKTSSPQPPTEKSTNNNSQENVSVAPSTNFWWLNANPKIWSFSSLAVGKEQSYTLFNENGNKRRIFQHFLDAQVGDKLICYESTPVKQIVAIGEITQASDGEKICFKKLEGLAAPIDYVQLRDCPELVDMEYFQNAQGSLFKLSPAEYDFLLDMIREYNPHPQVVGIPYSRADFLRDVYLPGTSFDMLKELLHYKKNIILQGAPGVGKTFAARRLAWAMMGSQDDSRIGFVQFHQNYAYEDFVLGYRPVQESFQVKSGVFYRSCLEAANHPEQDYFFIIDEINRGNLSKIFGELLMLIEKDYRGTRIDLPYEGYSLAVPENVYIIGTMNTADRSLAMMDYALRRRFSFVDMLPGFDTEGFKAYQQGLHSNTLNALIVQITALNQDIARDPSLGQGFCIGHSYFCGMETCTDERLRTIVDFDLLPMLHEYWFDNTAKYQEWAQRLQGVFAHEV